MVENNPLLGQKVLILKPSLISTLGNFTPHRTGYSSLVSSNHHVGAAIQHRHKPPRGRIPHLILAMRLGARNSRYLVDSSDNTLRGGLT